MAVSDKPSNQKSGINTIAGNAKVTGGDQPFIGSFAAPVTDNGLGQLAQGFGQAAAGSAQLAMAYKQRKEQDEDFATQMAITNATLGVAKSQEEVDNDPSYQELPADTIPSEKEKAFLALSKPQVEGFRSGLNARQQKQFDLAMAQRVGVYQQNVSAKGYQIALQKNTADAVNQINFALSGVQDLAATKGDTTQVAISAMDVVGALREKIKPLPIPQQMQIIEQAYGKIAIIYAISAQTRIAKDTTGDTEKVVKDILTEAEGMAQSLFPEDPGKQAALLGNLRGTVAEYAKEKQRAVVDDFRYRLDTSLSNYGSLLTGEGEILKMNAQQMALLPQEKQNAYKAALSLRPQREQMVMMLKGNTPINALEKQITAMELTVAKLLPEQQPEARKIVSGWASEIRSHASSPEQVAAVSSAFGKGFGAIVEDVARVNGGDLVAAGVTALEVGGKDIRAELATLDQTLRASSANANGAAQALQAVTTFTSGLSQVKVSGLSQTAVTYLTARDKGANNGQLRVFAIADNITGMDTQTAQKFIPAAYAGPNKMASDRQMTQQQLAEINAVVQQHPTMLALKGRYANAPQGVASSDMLGKVGEAILANAIANVDLKSADKVTDAKANVAKLMPIFEKSINTGSGGEALVAVGNGGSAFKTDRLMAPATLSAPLKTQTFAKQFQKEVIAPLLGYGDNPPALTEMRFETSPDKSGIIVTYLNDYGVRVVFGDANNKQLTTSWKEAQRIYDEGKKIAAASKATPQATVGARTINQLGLSPSQVAKNREAHNAAVLRARNKK